MNINPNSYAMPKLPYGVNSVPYAGTGTYGSSILPLQNTALQSPMGDLGGMGGGNSTMEMLTQLMSSILMMLNTLMPMLSGGNSQLPASSGFGNQLDLDSPTPNPYNNQTPETDGTETYGTEGDYGVKPKEGVTETPTDDSIIEQVGGDPNSITGGPGVQLNPDSNLPAIDPSQWTARDGSNGAPFATPFVSSNCTKTSNSISTRVKGGEGAEAQLNKTLGTGFYQAHVTPNADDQKGDITTFFLYSDTGSKGPQQQGFELDAEYNLTKPGTVTFGTWIDGVKYNEVTVDAPKGGQTIGFNIQPGKTQIGYVNPDGTFVPVSETKDSRITEELASHLKPMTNSWRMEGTQDNGQSSSITVDGFGRSDKPGDPAKAV